MLHNYKKKIIIAKETNISFYKNIDHLCQTKPEY